MALQSQDDFQAVIASYNVTDVCSIDHNMTANGWDASGSLWGNTTQAPLCKASSMLPGMHNTHSNTTKSMLSAATKQLPSQPATG